MDQDLDEALYPLRGFLLVKIWASVVGWAEEPVDKVQELQTSSIMILDLFSIQSLECQDKYLLCKCFTLLLHASLKAF